MFRHGLKKRYFGGGTVEMHLIHESKYVQKPLEAQFEDGTTNFQAILALKYGLDLIQTQFQGMKIISQHTFLLAKYLHDELISLKYEENGKNVIQMYSSAGEFQDPNVQGGIVNFNILQRNGSVFGFTEFKKIAVLNTEIKAQNFLRRITMQYGIVNGHSTYFHEFFFYCIVWKRSVQLNIFSFQRQYLEEKHKGALSQLQSNSIHC